MAWSTGTTDAFVFWVALLLMAYVHLGYPAAAWMRATIKPLRHTRAPIEPAVTVVVVAHNEAHRIAARLDNLFALDYPKEKIEIVLASDGSTDDTVDIARRYEDAGLIVRAFHKRRGKAAVLNDVIPGAAGEIVLLADARQQFDRLAVRRLVANFADKAVGAVSGELMMRPNSVRAAVGKGTSLYWRYEKFIRRHESQVGSTVGATGAIYAIRRVLFEPIPEDTILDDVLIPLRIVRAGYRVLFEPEARAYDGVSATAGQEFVRKVRTIAGTFQLLTREIWVFDPFRNAVWFETISHKALRLTMPLLQTLVLTANVRLAALPSYRLVLAAQLLFYAAAVAGYATRNARRPLALVTLPYTICLLSWATIVGFVHFITRRQKATWERVAATAAAAMESVAAPAGFDRRRSVR
jgi:cellulose synthase/poly-beta-1,6-N-acetylglucosamine synthase-like glycosyltransferase